MGEILDGLILLTKRGDSIYSCGKLKDLEEVMDSHAPTFLSIYFISFFKSCIDQGQFSYLTIS